MKSINNSAYNKKDLNLDTKSRHNTGDKDDYNNDINAGEVGAEGGIDNGAAELRQLRKKYKGALHPDQIK